MSLRDAIDQFVTGTYTVTRYGAGSRDSAGRWVAGSTSTFSIDAVVQPIRGREVQYLPEAHRSQEVRKVYTKTELRTMRSGSEADTVSIGSEAWSVISVEAWEAFGGDATGDYYKCLVARVPAP